MDSRYSGDDYSDLNDEDFKALTDAHNRIVALMGGQDPRNIVDALAQRKAGVGLSMDKAFEAEEVAEEEGEEAAAPAAEGAEGAPAPASVEVS